MPNTARNINHFATLVLLLLPAYAAAAPKPKTSAAEPKIALFKNYEALVAHFRKNRGTVFYDAATQSLVIDADAATATCGTFIYNAPWEEFDFNMVWQKLAYQKREVTFTLGDADKSKNESFDVSSAFAAPGRYAVKILYKNATLSVFVNGRLAHKPEPIADPYIMKTLKFYLNATFTGIRIANPEVVGSPEAPVTVKTPQPPVAPKLISLFQTQADFDKRWKLKKVGVYNPGTKTITIGSEQKGFPTIAFGFRYDKPWAAMELDINSAPNKFMPDRRPLFSIGLNDGDGIIGDSFTLDTSHAKSGPNRIDLVMKKDHVLMVYLDGKPAHEPITLLRNTTVDDLHFSFETSTPVTVEAVRIKADPE